MGLLSLDTEAGELVVPLRGEWPPSLRKEGVIHHHRPVPHLSSTIELGTQVSQS